MKKILLAVIAVLALTSCAKEKDPYRVSLENAIIEKLGDGTKVYIETFERVDSTTFGKELEYRQHIMDLRLQQNLKLLDKYRKQGLQSTAQMKREAILHDQEVIAGLADMAENLGELKDKVAYYDYHFTGRASRNGSKAEYKDYYCTITPEGEVINIDSSVKTLHKPMGRVIPGYLDLVKNGEDQE